jgi:hypothetical protein
MKREETDNTGRVGVHAVALAIEKTLNWIFREQPMSDHGIDAHIEIVDTRRDATGRLMPSKSRAGQVISKKKFRTATSFAATPVISTIGCVIHFRSLWCCTIPLLS